MTSISLRTLSSHLAPAVGDARATSALQEAAGALGITASALQKADALRLLEHLSTRSDVVGIAARLLKFRAEFAFDSLAAPT